MPRTEPGKAPKFDTPARRKLAKLVDKLGGATALSARLGKDLVDRSQISRWCAGDSRPGDMAQAAIVRIDRAEGGDGVFDWLTGDEKAKLKAMPRGAA